MEPYPKPANEVYGILAVVRAWAEKANTEYATAPPGVHLPVEKAEHLTPVVSDTTHKCMEVCKEA